MFAEYNLNGVLIISWAVTGNRKREGGVVGAFLALRRENHEGSQSYLCLL